MNKILIDLPVKVETERLILRAPQAGDGKHIRNVVNDGYDKMIKYLQFPKTLSSQEEYEKEARSLQAKWILREDIRYTCIDKATGTIIGRLGFPPQQAVWNTPKFGVSYFIRDSFCNQGMATEAANMMARIAFDYLKALKTEIYCDESNKASQRIPEKLNFTHEATISGLWPIPNKPLSKVKLYSCFNKKELPYLVLSYSFEV